LRYCISHRIFWIRGIIGKSQISDVNEGIAGKLPFPIIS
jgi:hypothetical protein